MFIVLGILCILIAAALIFAVIIQNSKGGGLSSTFAGGGATQMFGARRSNEMIEKVTWYLAVGLAVIAFVANIFGSSGTQQIDNTLQMQQEIINSRPATPALPDIGDIPTPPAPTEGGNE